MASSSLVYATGIYNQALSYQAFVGDPHATPPTSYRISIDFDPLAGPQAVRVRAMDDRLVGITRKDPVLASTISKRVRSVVDAMARERHQRVKDDELYDDDDQSDARREDVARAVMREIAECLARRCPVGKPRETITDDLTTAFVEALDKQLMDVGWERVKHVSDDLRRVVIVVSPGRRTHELELTIDDGFPWDVAAFRCPSVPTSILAPCTPSSDSQNYFHIRDMLVHLERQLAALDDLLDVLDDLRATMVVLDEGETTVTTTIVTQVAHAMPTADVSSDTHTTLIITHRIALGNHCTLQLSIDTRNPYALPAPLVLFGPDRYVAPLRKDIAERSHAWSDCAIPIRTKLMDLLHVTDLPGSAQPQSVSSESTALSPSTDDLDCAICYCFNDPLDNSHPSVACNVCSKLFHYACVMDWIKPLTTSRVSMGRVFGKCPHCDEAMEVAMR